jgi:hypothetical protein
VNQLQHGNSTTKIAIPYPAIPYYFINVQPQAPPSKSPFSSYTTRKYQYDFYYSF